ncbi:MAG TPA: EamA family transporter [Bryobacteraceae bacterium]|nr:EamA family transporter [Bryobacteraceae bacterium]HOL71946.1 EamA family transporter [Bryobacteraceae bacterium]HOQ44587.1 EamA family transporter [Bryobacteraceae bacterium]HPQ15309.1 EamA family transporter [Bryobacteraceae bacterium]HPU70906.1 EamA family transporter [Bryobacteraceae bacterium]
MAATDTQVRALSSRSLHTLGVASGLAAGAWLGVAEAPTKLVTLGFSPFLISLGMVAGVFTARWTLPVMIKGTGYIWLDLREKPHLVLWAVLAGMLWAVANTLTVFAIRNVGLSIAFPLWNINSLVGLFWGWLLFNELRGAGLRQRVEVLGGAAAIVGGACLLAYATSHQAAPAPGSAAALGIVAAVGAGILWGTMYIPYRKAYISGMNPLSFVTVFTFGELATVFVLAAAFDGGLRHVAAELGRARPALFWLFLGGFCWVLGDLFQQYAAKYVGIGRGIPLSNTNQLWGLAWGALFFGELTGQGSTAQALIIAGSLIMIAGAVAISLAEAPQAEQVSWRKVIERECSRYGLDRERVAESMRGGDPLAGEQTGHRWWEWLIAAAAVGVFVWLATQAEIPPIEVNLAWGVVLAAASLALLIACGLLLWKRTRFS